jgi:hypothetical protein
VVRRRGSARLAQAGSLRTVITTNFDTLIERELADVGVGHRVFNALLDEPPVGNDVAPVTVLKLHGAVSRRDSLVDLATQKRRGLPAPWLDCLQHAFAVHRVVVAGFSGADLALAEGPDRRWRRTPCDGQADDCRCDATTTCRPLLFSAPPDAS